MPSAEQPGTRLILHIGFHETRTQVIQESFFGFRVGLRDHGVVYPQPLSGHPSHLDLATALGFNPWVDQLPDLPSGPVIDRYRRLIADCRPGTTIVLSSEEFCQANFRPEAMDNLTAFLASIDVETIVVAYVRDPLRFLLDIYHHELRDTLSTARFADWVAGFDLRGADFTTRLAPWRTMFDPAVELVVRNHDDVAATGTSPLQDFLAACSLDHIDMLSVEHPVSEVHPLLVEPLIATRLADLDADVRRRHLEGLLEIGPLMAPIEDVAAHYLGERALAELEERLAELRTAEAATHS